MYNSIIFYDLRRRVQAVQQKNTLVTTEYFLTYELASPPRPSSHSCGLLYSSVRGYETQAESHRYIEQRTSDAEICSVRWAYLARFLATRADLSDSVGLVPVFKFQEPRGGGVDEALIVWPLGGE